MISDRVVVAGSLAGIVAVGLAASWYADRVVPPEPRARMAEDGPYVEPGDDPQMVGVEAEEAEAGAAD